MICKKCNNEAIKNVVLNKEFWYCKTCKIEIEDDSLTQEQIDELFIHMSKMGIS